MSNKKSSRDVGCVSLGKPLPALSRYVIRPFLGTASRLSMQLEDQFAVSLSGTSYSDPVLSRRKGTIRRAMDSILSLMKRPDTIVDVEGFKMRLDSKDALMLSVLSTYERRQTAVMKSDVKEGESVVDLGANIGYYTLLLSRLVGKNGRVFAFEPHPELYQILSENVESNNCTNVTLANKAVADVPGKTSLYLDTNGSAHCLYDPHNESPFIQTESVVLDDYLHEDSSSVTFVKLDIEGFEMKALEGAAGILRNQGLRIITEFNPHKLRGAGNSPEQYLRFLFKKGFSLFDIEDHLRPVQSTSKIEDYVRKYQKDSTNLLCRR